MSDIKVIEVTNRASHKVGYSLPDLGIHRSFEGGETKRLPLEEVQQLAWTTGGMRLMEKYLIVPDEKARESIFGKIEIEPEYLYSKEDVKRIVLNGTLDELDDCITFGPAGIKDLVVEVAVENNLADMNKRKLILDKIGYNVTKAIEIKEETAEAAPAVDDKPKRRAATPAAPVRKAAKPTWD